MFHNLAGGETEHAVSGIENGEVIPRDWLIAEILRRTAARYPCLPAISRRGFFTANGAHFYPDCGKVEATTPEVDNPYDLVRYVKANEVMLNSAAEEIETDGPPGHREVLICRGNVDYSSEATWGSHSSYQHKCSPVALHAALLSHLATRAIYAGSGGWRSARGLEFTLSPRAAHVDRVASSDSTNGGRRGGRPILHTKDEPLSHGGYHRLHLILGDSNYSEKALFLRFGTTQLLTALADAGVESPQGITLRNPVGALHAVAADVSCRGQLALAEGGKATAIEVQRRYLEHVERHLSKLPPWAPRVTRLWAEILDGLERDPMSLRGTLDWPFRLALYQGYAQRQGRSLDGIAQAVEAVSRMQESLDRTAWRGQTKPVDFLIGPHSPVLKMAAHLTGSMRMSGQKWRDLGEQADWQRRFFELDVKLGRIGPKGLFHVLDKAGLMPDHRIVRPQDITDACENPPGAGTRAHLRGKAVRELARTGSGASCEWNQVFDPARKRVLDLNDPMTREAKWIDAPVPVVPDLPEGRRTRAFFDAIRGLR